MTGPSHAFHTYAVSAVTSLYECSPRSADRLTRHLHESHRLTPFWSNTLVFQDRLPGKPRGRMMSRRNFETEWNGCTSMLA